MKKRLNLSVVCATHNGSKKIKNLIFSVNNNYVLPKEIIICGTSISDLKYIPKNILRKLNIKFIYSHKKSQIIQRITAINYSVSDYILQIDDDVVIKPNFFLNISKYVSMKSDINKKVVSALIVQRNKDLQAGTWNTIYKKYLLFRLLVLLLNKGKEIKEYSMLNSGRCVPFIKGFDKKLTKNIKNVEWLCSTILYHRNSRLNIKIPKQNTDKAYYEDVFFSHQLYKKKYKLLIDVSVIGIHDNQPYTSISTYFKTLSTQYDIVKIFKKSKTFFFLDVVVFTMIHLFRDLYKKMNSN